MKNTLIGPKLTNWEEEKGKTNFLYFINTKGRKKVKLIVVVTRRRSSSRRKRQRNIDK